MKEFIPQNEQERKDFEELQTMVTEMNGSIIAMPKQQRIPFLRLQADVFVQSLHVFALKNEDYEVCEAAKVVLEERGIKYKG